MEMKVKVFVVLLGTLVLPVTNSAADPKKGTGTREQILQRFVDEFVQLTPGKGKFPASFTMGSPATGRANEQPAYKVTFARTFAMARYEVTQELYEAVM